MADLGTDIALIVTDEGLDLDPYFGLVTGRRALIQAIAARLDSRPGSLWYDPDYGRDLKRWLNETLDAGALFRISAEVEAEALKDERVLEADARVTFDAAAKRLRVSLALVDAEGPFALVLSVDSVSVAILEAA